MGQGANILESLQDINEELERLKPKITDVSKVDGIEKIQKDIEELKSVLPKYIHGFNTTAFEEYVNKITQIEKEALELRGISNMELTFIIDEITRCKTKAEKRLQEKKNKNKNKVNCKSKFQFEMKD